LATTEGHCGAIAFSRTGDPALGDFEDAVILKAVGEVDSGLLSGSKALGGSGLRRRTASRRPHGSMSIRGFDPEWSSTAEGGARIGRRQAPILRRAMRAPLTGSKPRKKGGFHEVGGAPRQALGAKGQRAFCCRGADKLFAWLRWLQTGQCILLPGWAM